MSTRYVALGSSMAAGPGIKPSAPGAPFGSGRSALNYPHLIAERAGFDLVDVTYSGATTAHILSESQRGAPPQITALDGSESLVTITIGGNDVGYVPMLMAALAPRPLRMLPVIGTRIRGLLDPAARDRALVEVAESLRMVGATVRSRAPKARVLFVTYLTLLPPPGIPAGGLTGEQAHLGRHIADRLAQLTEYAAASTGCEVVPAASASRDHHAWSSDPWTVGAAWPIPGRPAPFHPNPAGMRAVADLVLDVLGVSGR
jgi:lysophospholipase L1-like esterase